jgi:hypothetical protein
LAHPSSPPTKIDTPLSKLPLCPRKLTALDFLEDLLSTYRYVTNDLSTPLSKPGLVDPSCIIVAGHSGEGYSSILATLEVMKSADLKRPLATVAVCPMLDFWSLKWSVECIDFGVLSDENTETGREDLERRMALKKISFGEELANSEADGDGVFYSWTLMCYIVKAPVYVDLFSGISGLGKRLASVQPVAPFRTRKS